MSYQCPNCQRVLDDRQLTHCSSCGTLIPETLRDTPEKIAARDPFQAEFERLVQLDKEWRDYFAQQQGGPEPGAPPNPAQRFSDR